MPLATPQRAALSRTYVSWLTAKTHVSLMLYKLHARDRAQLVMLAYESGLVVPGT